MSNSDTQTNINRFLFLAEATAWRYRALGHFVHGFVRGKLRHDPIYRELLSRNLLPPEGLVLDLGCGRGILLSLLATARGFGFLPQGNRRELRLRGIELRLKDAGTARLALGQEAEIVVGDLHTEALPSCRAAILLDVLLYLGRKEQDALLERVAEALVADGVLIIREADVGRGWRFTATWVAERFCALARGHWRQRYCYRSAAEWREKLESLGFAVETQPMSEGTPFANVLFIARRA